MKRKYLLILQFILLMLVSCKSVYATIKIKQNNLYLGINYEIKLKVYDNESNNLIWVSSDSSIVSINDGTIRGKGIGTAYIKVSDGKSIDICKVSVTAQYMPVLGITLPKNSDTILVGDTINIGAITNPKTASNQKIVYATDAPNIASVDDYGNVTALKTGLAHISLSIEEKAEIFTVNVIDKIPLKGISVAGPINLKVGASTKLNITYTPSDATDKSITLKSSNGKVVTVDANGNLKATGIGSATITIISNDGNYTATTKVTVTGNSTPSSSSNSTQTNIPLKGISLNKKELTLNKGTSEKLTITYNPNNATNKSITWVSSNNSVVTVDSSGTIKAISEGKATITVTSNEGNYKETCAVTVVEETPTETGKLKGISLSKTTLTMNVDETSKLSVRYTPSNATNKSVTWVSSDDNVVIVDSSGTIKAISEGTATITVTSNEGNYTATCNVIVTKDPIALKKISLSKSKISIKKGETKTLEVSYEPENATNKEVTWEINNPEIATVESGTITALNPGTTYLVVKSVEGKYTATCTIAVLSDEPISEIAFSKNRITSYVGDTIELEMVTTPQYTAIDNPIWKSSDESVATVDEEGIVTGKKSGISTITISNADGSISATTTINIIDKPDDTLKITIEGYELNFDPSISNYTLEIGNENSLIIKTNIDSSKVIINGNQNLKNGSIITITINKNEKKTYVINIKKKANYIIYFLVIISILLIANLVRILLRSKKDKSN